MITKILHNAKKKVGGFFGKFKLVPQDHSQVLFISMIIIVAVSSIGFLPLLGVDGLFIKHLVLPIFAGLGLIIIAIRALQNGYFTLPEKRIAWALVAFLAVLFVSSLVSDTARATLFGSLGIAPSFAFILSLGVIFYLASNTLKSTSRVFGILITVGALYTLVFIHHVLRFIFGSSFGSFGFLNTQTMSLFGSWTDFALWSFLIIVFAIICLEVGRFVKSAKWVTIVLGSFGIVGLFLTNIFWVWVITGIIAILVSIYIFALAYWNPKKSSYDKGRNVPWYSLSVFMFVLIGVLFGGAITNALSKIQPLSYSEVSPSYSATIRAGALGTQKSPLFGIGMNNFGSLWDNTKPQGLSGTVSGNLEFATGKSFITTQLATTGILGMLAWLLLGILFAIKYVTVVRTGFHDSSDRFGKILALTGSLVLTAVVIIHAPGISVLVLWAVFVGALWGISETKEIKVSFIDDPRASFFGIIAVLLLVILGGSLTYVSVKKISSVVQYHQSLQSFASNDRPTGIQKLVRANQLWPTDFYNRTLAQQVLAEVQNIQPTETTNKETFNQEIERLLSIGLAYAEAAVRFDKNNYRNWVILGDVYQLFGGLNVQESYERAQTAYETAQKLSPNDRTLDLLFANLARAQGNTETANQIVRTSLQTYQTVDAWLWLYQQSVAAKNYTQAEEYLINALRVDRSNTRVMSELGIIYFIQGDYTQALSAFEQSLSMNRNQPLIFAYLGVTYESLGRTNDAEQVFRFLRRQLPGATANRAIDAARSQKQNASLFESELEITEETNSETQ